jgi:hypothetical protein
MSTLELDRSDPAVDELVSGWADGETYTVTLTIVQKKSDAKKATYDVTAVESEEAPAEETGETMKEDTEGKEATYGKHKGPAIVIAFKK